MTPVELFKQSMRRGPKPKYQTVKEVQKVIEEYFGTITKENPPTVTGLALFLGYSSLEVLNNVIAARS
jgi:hypothetical protein